MSSPIPPPQKPLSSPVAAAEIQEQTVSNSSGIDHFDTFAIHRERLTRVVLAAATKVGADTGVLPRLCVLGAGNANDLDLERLATVYGEIHLVDIDEPALVRAMERQKPVVRNRIVRHTALDLSGLLDSLDRWRDLTVDPAEALRLPQEASERIAKSLPGPFDVVVSACLLSQMQLTVLRVLSSTHRLFEPARQFLNLIHLRTLALLMARHGRAVLATDVSSDLIYPLEQVDKNADLRSLLTTLVSEGHVIQIVSPPAIGWTIAADPLLSATVRVSEPVDAWIWENGPARLFLVYAAELSRIDT